MRRHALLIGAPDERLRGVEGDLDRMEEALGLHGFTCARLYGAAATRAGILGALRALPDQVEAGDAVVVYFSGHGGEVRSRAALNDAPTGEPREPAFHRCLIPTDIGESTADDFRGILSIELDVRLAAIADRSANVAVILDCCHSEGIARGDDDLVAPRRPDGGAARPVERDLSLGTPRDPSARTVRLGAPWLAPIAALRRALLDQGIDPDDLAAEADPRVIRLTACGPREIAIERTDERGRAGLFTSILAARLGELAGRTTTWLALGRAVRRQVRAHRQGQSAAIKGPADRLLFRLEQAPIRRVVALVGRVDRPRLAGGAMLAIEPGDRFLLAALAEEDGIVASAVVGRTAASSAEITVAPLASLPPERPPTAAASAIPLRYERPRGHVRVRASASIEALLERALPASGLVEVADAATTTPPLAVIAEVDDTLTICDVDGAQLRPPIALEEPPGLDAALGHVAEVVEGLALARALVDLEAPAAELALERTRVQWSLYTSAGGRSWVHSTSLCTANAPLRLGPGVRLVVTVRDAFSLMSPLFAWIFFVCPSGQVTLLSHRHPWGAPVGADEPYILGERIAGVQEGIEVTAAPVIPRDGSRRGDLILIAADGQADLRSWERRVSLYPPADPLQPTSPLRGRDEEADPLPGLARRFAVWRVAVDLGNGS